LICIYIIAYICLMAKKKLNKIKEVLDARKITQQVLANKAEIGFASINMYYNGKREPSLETLKTISEALGVPGKDLINF